MRRNIGGNHSIGHCRSLFDQHAGTHTNRMIFSLGSSSGNTGGSVFNPLNVIFLFIIMAAIGRT